MNTRLIRGDIRIVCAILALCAVLGFLVYAPWNKQASGFVTVSIDGNVFQTYPLNQKANIVIGDTGVRLVIQEGQAYIAESDCPDGVCLASGAITASSPSGKSLVCLPNKVAVIKSDGPKDKSGVDAVAG